jgi:hypothetical protein
MFKNFLYIAPLAIWSALMLALAFDQNSVSIVLKNFFSGAPNAEIAPFFVIFRCISILNFRSVGVFFADLAGIVLLIVSISLMMALIEKHMRIGKRTFNGLFSKLNDNLISTGSICLLYVVIYELWALITSALLFCVSLFNSPAAVYVFSVIVFFGMHFVLLYIVSLFYLWLPCLQITGFRAFEALRYSYQLVSPVKMKIVLGQWISVSVMEVLLAVCAVFVQGTVPSLILAAILYMFMTMIFCIRMQVVYFDRAQMERADLRRYYYF